MILFLDLSTSGPFIDRLPIHDKAQPWACQLAFEHTDADGARLNACDLLIKAEGRTIKEGAEQAHGVGARSTEINGIKEAVALALLSDVAGKSQVVVTYGALDTTVVDSLLIRLATRLANEGRKVDKDTYLRRWRRPGLAFLNIQAPVCQQECKLEGDEEGGEYRLPSLAEASKIILGADDPGKGRGAWAGLDRCRDLYFALRARGHFSEVGR